MTRRVRSAKWLLAGTIMAGVSLNPLVSVSGENKDSGSTTASEEADPNVLRPTTNDFLDTPEYEEWTQASANVRDIVKLAQALPPGSDAAKALDVGIKGERNVIEGLINLHFIQEIMGVLVEEIQDRDILARIAVRLKTVMIAGADNE